MRIILVSQSFKLLNYLISPQLIDTTFWNNSKCAPFSDEETKKVRCYLEIDGINICAC